MLCACVRKRRGYTRPEPEWMYITCFSIHWGLPTGFVLLLYSLWNFCMCSLFTTFAGHFIHFDFMQKLWISMSVSHKNEYPSWVNWKPVQRIIQTEIQFFFVPNMIFVCLVDVLCFSEKLFWKIKLRTESLVIFDTEVVLLHSGVIEVFDKFWILLK